MQIDMTSADQRAVGGLRHYMNLVFGWMSLGLAVTGGCGAYMASDPRMIMNLTQNHVLFYGLLIAQVGIVLLLSFMVKSMSASTAKFAFLFYAALTGVTMSTIFLVFTSGSIASTFFVTAAVFGAMSFYGYVTKADLTAMGSLLMMGLFGLILASVVNVWLRSPAVQWATTYIGILIFTGLTAYDTQKIKEMYQSGADGTELETKAAILGALALYLDFINLFFELLQIFGSRRD
jgi:FtsH-binding integral membrane protein